MFLFSRIDWCHACADQDGAEVAWFSVLHEEPVGPFCLTCGTIAEAHADPVKALEVGMQEYADLVTSEGDPTVQDI